MHAMLVRTINAKLYFRTCKYLAGTWVSAHFQTNKFDSLRACWCLTSGKSDIWKFIDKKVRLEECMKINAVCWAAEERKTKILRSWFIVQRCTCITSCINTLNSIKFIIIIFRSTVNRYIYIHDIHPVKYISVWVLILQTINWKYQSISNQPYLYITHIYSGVIISAEHL